MSRKIDFGIGEYYHIYSRGVEKRPIFLDVRDHTRFVRLLYAANSDSSIQLSNYQGRALLEIPRSDTVADLGAWCLMPNHFHLLLKEKEENGISRYMHKVLTGYSMYFNAKHQRTGTLFEGNFNAKHLDSDNYLKYQYAYIHLNPIGIIDAGWKENKIKDKSAAKKFLTTYKYSSFQDYSGEKREESAIIEPKAFPEYFSSFTDFGQMINEWIDFETL